MLRCFRTGRWDTSKTTPSLSVKLLLDRKSQSSLLGIPRHHQNLEASRLHCGIFLGQPLRFGKALDAKELKTAPARIGLIVERTGNQELPGLGQIAEMGDVCLLDLLQLVLRIVARVFGPLQDDQLVRLQVDRWGRRLRRRRADGRLRLGGRSNLLLREQCNGKGHGDQHGFGDLSFEAFGDIYQMPLPRRTVSRPFRPQRVVNLSTQGVGLRPRPWAPFSRPVGPA
jgi:hypothetical protein